MTSENIAKDTDIQELKLVLQPMNFLMQRIELQSESNVICMSTKGTQTENWSDLNRAKVEDAGKETERNTETVRKQVYSTNSPEIKVNGQRKKVASRQKTEEYRRLCLRKSLQRNIELLVEHLPFFEAEIQDSLISKECLTETECNDIRQSGGKKNQIRNLVRIIKQRSFKDMMAFLDCLKDLHPTVASKVWDVYEKSMDENSPQVFKCTFCRLKSSTDIKLIADRMWSRDLISEELYDAVVVSVKPMWEELAEEFNKSAQQVEIMHTFRHFLSERRQTNLISGLRNVTDFECSCDSNKLVFRRKMSDNFGEEIDYSTASPFSTRSITSSEDRAVHCFEIPEDETPSTVLENQFLSPRTIDRDWHNDQFGRRQSVEHHKGRSNSFCKKIRWQIPNHLLEKRRSSTFD